MGLQSLYIFNSFSVAIVYRRQILTSIDDSHTERVKRVIVLIYFISSSNNSYWARNKCLKLLVSNTTNISNFQIYSAKFNYLLYRFGLIQDT